MGAMWKERRGGRWIWKKSYYCFSMQPVWRLKWLSNIIWAGNSQYFKIGWDWDQKWQRQEKEREREGKEGGRTSVQLWGVPSSTKLLQLPSSLLLLLRERERVSNRERARESRLQGSGEETSRGGSTKEKNPSLSSPFSLRASYGQQGAERSEEDLACRFSTLLPCNFCGCITVRGARGELPIAWSVTSLRSRRAP